MCIIKTKNEYTIMNCIEEITILRNYNAIISIDIHSISIDLPEANWE